VRELRTGLVRATAERLGETAGDPVKLSLSGDPALVRRYEVR
jgi:hypothetical protein